MSDQKHTYGHEVKGDLLSQSEGDMTVGSPRQAPDNSSPGSSTPVRGGRENLISDLLSKDLLIKIRGTLSKPEMQSVFMKGGLQVMERNLLVKYGVEMREVQATEQPSAGTADDRKAGGRPSFTSQSDTLFSAALPVEAPLKASPVVEDPSEKMFQAATFVTKEVNIPLTSRLDMIYGASIAFYKSMFEMGLSSEEINTNAEAKAREVDALLNKMNPWTGEAKTYIQALACNTLFKAELCESEGTDGSRNVNRILPGSFVTRDQNGNVRNKAIWRTA